MSKLKIKIINLGEIEVIKSKEIKNIKSKVFEINNKVEKHTINSQKSNGYSWEFDDIQLKETLPENFDEDVLIAVTFSSVENNFYLRTIDDNRFVISLSPVNDYLNFKNIPTKNFLLKIIYGITLAKKANMNWENVRELLIHDETRGCPFDMNGNLSEITTSCSSIKICNTCKEILKNNNVSCDYIKKIQKELKRIKLPRYVRISNWIKQNPWWSIIITIIFNILCNLVAGLILS